MACWSLYGIPGQACPRKASIVFSIHFTQPNRPAWEWDWRSAVQLWKDTVDEYGPRPTSRGARPFTSRSLPLANRSRYEISTTDEFDLRTGAADLLRALAAVQHRIGWTEPRARSGLSPSRCSAEGPLPDVGTRNNDHARKPGTSLPPSVHPTDPGRKCPCRTVGAVFFGLK